ncbi:MAG: FHA domain-containing protein [Acidobacteria bacterium]|nr:FHA domain-containing protein [Acidobacteriota bacterium]
MAKLELRFENNFLAEYPLSMKPMTMGRGHDCDIFIDNLAVSTHHARILFEDDQYILEDNKSLNGTFVNGIRVDRVQLRDGDSISIGKHSLFVHLHSDARQDGTHKKVIAPRLDGTVMLDTKQRKELLKQPQEARAVADRLSVAHLQVIAGKTDQADYVLTSQLTLIGKSDMANVRLRGWFKPKSAAVITRRKENYYVGIGSNQVQVKLNGAVINSQQVLGDGDVIEVAGARFSFTLPKQSA